MWTSFHTTDLDEGLGTLSEVFNTAVPRVPPGVRRLDMHLEAEVLPRLTVSRVTYGVEFIFEAQVQHYQIVNPASGGMVYGRSGDHDGVGPGQAALINPGMATEVRCTPDLHYAGISITERVLRHQLQTMLDRTLNDRVMFLPQLSSPQWSDIVNVAVRAASSGDGLLAHPLSSMNLQNLVIDGLLLTAPHNYSAALADDPRASTAAVAATIEMIHESPQLPWTTATLARKAGVSARSLQKAFAAENRPPPMSYLRQVRLKRVFEELLRAPPGVVTVSAVARRWGFLHAGRFAAQYRELFGQRPSDTLRSVGPEGTANLNNILS